MLIGQAYAQTAGGGGMDLILLQLLPFLPVIAIFYFLVIRPQQQRAKAHQQLIEGLRRGDQVITSGGIIGKIVKVDESEVTVEVAEGVKLRVLRQTIMDVRSKGEPA